MNSLGFWRSRIAAPSGGWKQTARQTLQTADKLLYFRGSVLRKGKPGHDHVNFFDTRRAVPSIRPGRFHSPKLLVVPQGDVTACGRSSAGQRMARRPACMGRVAAGWMTWLSSRSGRLDFQATNRRPSNAGNASFSRPASQPRCGSTSRPRLSRRLAKYRAARPAVPRCRGNAPALFRHACILVR